VTEGLTRFFANGILGRYALVTCPGLFADLQRIQQGTGTTEYERIMKLLDGNVFKTPLIRGRAILVCAEPQYIDLVIGQDMVTAYLETRNLNHYFRIMETALLRIKNKAAVIVFD